VGEIGPATGADPNDIVRQPHSRPPIWR